MRASSLCVAVAVVAVMCSVAAPVAAQTFRPTFLYECRNTSNDSILPTQVPVPSNCSFIPQLGAFMNARCIGTQFHIFMYPDPTCQNVSAEVEATTQNPSCDCAQWENGYNWIGGVNCQLENEAPAQCGGPSTGFPTGGNPTGFPTGGNPTGLPISGLPTGFPTGFPTGGLPTGFPTGGFPTGFPSGLPTGFPSGLPTGGLPTGAATTGQLSAAAIDALIQGTNWTAAGFVNVTTVTSLSPAQALATYNVSVAATSAVAVIRMNIDFATFGPAARDQFKATLAATLGVDPSRFTIVFLEGSVVAVIEIGAAPGTRTTSSTGGAPANADSDASGVIPAMFLTVAAALVVA